MSVLLGPVTWSHSRDIEGYRDYELWWLIQAENTDAGHIDDPATIANTAGLPAVGSSWSDLPFINGQDDWAYCSPEYEVEPYGVNQGEAPQYYLYKARYTNRPLKRCSTTSIENPILEPPVVTGSWVDRKRIPHVDRNGLPYRSSTGEPLAGAETEIDDSDWEITISFNSLTIPSGLVNSLRHHLNDAPLWGFPIGTVKFSKYSFARRLYGTCNYYYNNVMSFSIRGSWTQYLADKGYMMLKDGGDKNNPDDWVRAVDSYDSPLPLMRLDVFGKPIVSDDQTPSTIERDPYPLGNLLALGIPASI